MFFVDNNWLHAEEKSALEAARENLSNKDPAVREKAEKEERRLVVLSVERNKEVIAACSGPGAASEACKQKRTEAVLAQMGYEDGPYNSKYKDAYPDEYQHISAILDQTSQKTQDQLAVRDAVAANLAKTYDISLEEAYKKYDRYAATRDVIAIVGGTIGGIGVANRIPGEKPAGQSGHIDKGGTGLDIKQLPDANGKNHLTAVKGDATIPVDKIELYMRGKAYGDLGNLNNKLNRLRDERMANPSAFDKNPEKVNEWKLVNNQIHNVQRSQAMANDLNRIGIVDTPKNNQMIMGELLDTAKNITPENRKTSIVLTGENGGSVRITATWAILPDGSKRLSTVQTGAFK